MKTSIKATILAAILAAGIGGTTCGGFTKLEWPGNSETMTNCQYNTLKTALIEKYPTGKEVVEIDDWQMLIAVMDKEIKKQGNITLSDVKNNVFEKIINTIK